MALRRLWSYLLPQAAEREEPFRQELLRTSHAGLRTLGAVEIALPILIQVARMLLSGSLRLEAARAWQTLSLAVVGAATILGARPRWSQAHARALALLSAGCAILFLIWVSLLFAPQYYSGDDLIPAGLTVVMLTVAAAVPVLPLHMLLLGLSAEIVYLASKWVAPPQLDGHSHDIFIFVLTLLTLALAVTNYAQRRRDFEAHQQALRVTEALAGAQLRAQLAESAMAIGKMAAALTHEINTPLGALKSAVDTILVVAARQATATPEQQPRLVGLQADLRRSIQASSERISAVVARLQRFINLEEADVQTANLNELLGDVAILFEEQTKDKIRLEFHFGPIPALTCRPQLLSAVFSSLLSNAINAVDGDGLIEISTRQVGSGVEVTIRDNGRGMPPEAVENIFDPGFKVLGSRMSTGNWSLFNTRQIIFEHGGDIQIDSVEGRGTTVSVTLPC